jgi:c-di-GMP-binding flagellar brake protein YcgR
MEIQEVIRQYFRINVKDTDSITIKVDGHKYDVVDVGDSGIGIRLSPEDIFLAVEDELGIELNIDGIVHNLQGKVVHISPNGPEEFLCGIEFIKIDKKSQEQLMDYLRNSRTEIFQE